ncbi:MAG: hypothetical protein Hals2KO_35810 [Halioglobus sp.]
MRKQFIFAYGLATLLALWALYAKNYEFLLYAVVAIALVVLIHFGDAKFAFSSPVLWGFNLWLVMHSLGGLLPVADGVLYSFVLIDLVGPPYSILKYDQVVHVYCYFIVALLLWKVLTHYLKSSTRAAAIPTPLLVTVTVLAATGIGGINEIIEFAATVLVPETNVGGYENTAIDIVSNLVGACLAIPFFRGVFREE